MKCVKLSKKTSKKKKKNCHSVTKTFGSSQNSSVPFRVTFNHSFSCVLLIDETNESFKNSQKIERKTIPTTKRKEKKIIENEKEIVLHQQRQTLRFQKLLQNA